MKYFQYAYLVFAVLFIIDGFKRINDGTGRMWVSWLLAALAIFMFFFRRRFRRKFEERNKQ